MRVSVIVRLYALCPPRFSLSLLFHFLASLL
jgi:hypothetical protein